MCHCLALGWGSSTVSAAAEDGCIKQKQQEQRNCNRRCSSRRKAWKPSLEMIAEDSTQQQKLKHRCPDSPPRNNNNKRRTAPPGNKKPKPSSTTQCNTCRYSDPCPVQLPLMMPVGFMF